MAAACGGGGDTSGAPAGADELDRNATVRYAISYGHTNLDPHRSPFVGDTLWMKQVYDRLVTFAPTSDGGLELAPQLATSFDVAEDGLSIEFELREDVTFHDGTTFDADAVRANMERAQHPDSTVASNLTNLESVEVVGPTRVVFRMSQPDPAILWNMALAAGMMVSPAAFDSDLTTTPVGAGPFTLVSAQQDADVVFERYDDYWDPDRPLAQSLIVSTISDAGARFNGVRAGEFSVAYLGSPHDSQSQDLESDGFQREVTLDTNAYGLLLNTNMAPFDDVRVRRAVNMAFNREEISETLLNGLQPPSYQAFQEGSLGYDPALDEDAFDPDAARDLVQQAGAEGASVRIIQTATEPQSALAEVVQQSLGDIGLDVELVPLSPSEARPAFQDGGFHGEAGIIIGRNHPSQTLDVSYLGGPGTPPAELVEMANAASLLPHGSSEAAAAYQQISRYLVQNPIHVPIARFVSVHLCAGDVIGCETLLGPGQTQFHDVGLGAS